MHELAKEFPEKTYRELEKYRDADRQEEAQRIITQQENEELKEDQHKEDWKKRAQEAEGELSILKGIETNRVKEAQARSGYQRAYVDRAVIQFEMHLLLQLTLYEKRQSFSFWQRKVPMLK